MGSGEADAVKYQPVVGSITFNGAKYKDKPIDPDAVLPEDRLPLYPCRHDPYITYTIPPKDKEVILDALQLLAAENEIDSEFEAENIKVRRIIKYLGG